MRLPHLGCDRVEPGALQFDVQRGEILRQQPLQAIGLRLQLLLQVLEDRIDVRRRLAFAVSMKMFIKYAMFTM